MSIHITAGLFLSYDKWGSEIPARVKMQSGAAKDPLQWELRSKGGDEYTLEAVRDDFGRFAF
jgi:hypothetical protein